MTNSFILIDPAPMPGYWLYQAIKKVIEKSFESGLFKKAGRK
jgi:hypothetical protein